MAYKAVKKKKSTFRLLLRATLISLNFKANKSSENDCTFDGLNY